MRTIYYGNRYSGDSCVTERSQNCKKKLKLLAFRLLKNIKGQQNSNIVTVEFVYLLFIDKGF